MTQSIETLALTPDQRATYEEEIRRRAYHEWEEAGHPDDSAVECWLKAEQHWIEDHQARRAETEASSRPTPAWTGFRNTLRSAVGLKNS